MFCPEGLKEVTIPDGVVGISSKAFGYNKNIEKIVIPDSVVYIGLFAFSLCDALVEVYVSERYSGPMDVFPNTATIIRYSPVSSVADDAVQAQSRIIDAMDEYTDVKLVECVSNETQYVAFRKWLNSRSDRFTQWFKDSPNAKFAYILDAYSTFASLPRSEDLKIDGFERGSGSDDFSLSVLVGGIYVGDRALPENLDMLFGVEGSDELSSGGFSSGNVKVEFGTPSDGKVKIKATPRDGAAKSFFFRVKMK
ncbi:MAG: leucine-rich repeat protein [Kiritimatiellae bacterium]|nr:leucine-rich repeat protein [Kiritimatiellia bacterium]